MSAAAVTAPRAGERSRRPVASSVVLALLPARPEPGAGFAWRLETSLAAAAQARARVRWFLGTCGTVPGDVADAAVTVASELVANACTATVKLAGPGPEPPVELSLRLFADRLLVEVTDTSPEVPRPRLTQDGEAEHGRGLAMVDALSLEWGYFRHQGVKVVYSTVPLTIPEETDMFDEPAPPAGSVDTTRPSSPRAYSFAAGGKDHFAADRQAARRIMAMSADAARVAADNRAFLSRAVAHVAGRGVRQFIDIGAGLPLPGGNVHDWALAADPGARVCYVDSDPEVVVHLKGRVEHRPQVAAVLGNLRTPRHFLAGWPAEECLDLRQPVAVILGAVLHFLGDAEAYDAVEVLKRVVAPGSYLVISHATRDGAKPGEAEKVQGTYKDDLAAPLTLREGREIGGFFDGWEWAGPGLVNVNEWRNPVAVKTQLILYGGVARKPPSLRGLARGMAAGDDFAG